MVPVALIVIIVAGILALLNFRSGQASEPTPGLTAAAELSTPDGAVIGTVTFLQTATGVLVMADAKQLAPGGHAFIIHEVGACTPDFDAAGDHFNPSDAEHGFIHSAWKGGESGGGHGGDLPNIYAAARTVLHAQISLPPASRSIIGADHSIFDTNGSAIIIHEKPDSYGEEESDTGSRVACGIITRT